MSATIVTALYNIGRDNLSGKWAHRSFTKYLNWFKNLLSINAPMVIFIPEELHYYIREHRSPHYATKVVIREFTDLAAYKYHDRIQQTIDKMVKQPDPYGGIPRHFSECPEFITAKYETIIFSKFDFLKEVAEENPHDTDYFIWLDAGTFYDPPPFDCSLPWPDPYKIHVLQDKFLLSNYSFDVNNKAPLKDKRDYLRRNQNDICAFALGGKKSAIDRVHTQFWEEVENALSLGVINNEQHILQLMALEKPEYYYLWSRTRYRYIRMPLPLRDRMIPVELAVGTDFGENYAVEPRVKSLTLATKEINPLAYAKWETTSDYYGYNYEIIGRNRPWKGFGTKIKAFHDRLQTVTEPYAVLTDATDLYFCGPAMELHDKFVKLGVDVIVSGEMNMYYPGGHYDHEVIRQFFEGIQESEQRFPNSGFIMGKTESLKKMLELHLEYSDDQGPCFDTIFENRHPLVVDYHTVLIGNVPNYLMDGDRAMNYFKYDEKTRRYRNIYSNEAPVALHFPGRNFYVMKHFYATSGQPSSSTVFDDEAGWVVFAILLIVFLILIFYLTLTYARI